MPENNFYSKGTQTALDNIGDTVLYDLRTGEILARIPGVANAYGEVPVTRKGSGIRDVKTYVNQYDAVAFACDELHSEGWAPAPA